MDIQDYVSSNAIGPSRVKQSPSNWEDFGTTYRATRDSYSKQVNECLWTLSNNVILKTSGCVPYLTKLTEKLSNEMSEADTWALIFFNTLVTDKQTGTVETDDGWAMEVVDGETTFESSPGQYVGVRTKKGSTKIVDYGDGSYNISNWRNWERTYKNAHCTLKQMLNFLRGLNCGEGADAKFITPPFNGTQVFAPPYEGDVA